ncbi:hypothetical protein GOP47_0011666 [Adiantum capillus-veneris]|uniref:Homeobox domain-containing protein n=1 Tax=Adiantum capillus-veneris TaxID=13818 RepID=A0A9D4UUL2_ADICA|nr:hypothetical protein GOP47_0011666 [Adiantum capillus-veneris]
MGGQTPVFFPSSSFIVASHKTSQDLHDIALLANKQQLNRAGAPLQLVDFKEVIGGGGCDGGGSGGSVGEQIRMGKRPHVRFASGSQDYDPGPGSARSVGEDMNMEYMEHMEGGDYMDHLEGGVGELMKKGSRRLGYDQVKALEKAFEVENRLEPERKVRLASQLGLQPRQVAVWFQNRRARWKTKQMERDYTLLKNKFEALKADRDKLLQEKDHLQAELTRLKGHALVEGNMLGSSKAATKGEQDSPTLASGSLVDDAAPINQQTMSKKRAMSSHRELDDHHLDEEDEEDEIEEEAGSPPMKPVMHEQKLLIQTDSLSSSEDSDLNNDGAIVDSRSKAFQEEPADYYAQHWRLPPAPTQLLYKPTIIKSEEWPEQGHENMNSFSMPLDSNWYNW